MSLLLALLRHVFHHILLLFRCLRHLLLVDTLGELGHEQGDTDHNNEGVLQVGEGIDFGLRLEVLDARRGLKLQRVHQTVVFAIFERKEVRFGVFTGLELFCVDLDDDGLEVELKIEHFKFVSTS